MVSEAGILCEDLSSTMRATVGLRNLLAHLLWEVDGSMIYADIDKREAAALQAASFATLAPSLTRAIIALEQS